MIPGGRFTGRQAADWGCLKLGNSEGIVDHLAQCTCTKSTISALMVSSFRASERCTRKNLETGRVLFVKGSRFEGLVQREPKGTPPILEAPGLRSFKWKRTVFQSLASMMGRAFFFVPQVTDTLFRFSREPRGQPSPPCFGGAHANQALPLRRSMPCSARSLRARGASTVDEEPTLKEALRGIRENWGALCLRFLGVEKNMVQGGECFLFGRLGEPFWVTNLKRCNTAM